MDNAVSGAAPISPEILRFFMSLGVPIYEGYGMTENSAIATGNTPDKVKLGTVGTPQAGTEIKLAEDGEILVRHPGVFLGYYKNEEATKEVLHSDGWLYTGDVGEYDGEFLKIIDRKKDIGKPYDKKIKNKAIKKIIKSILKKQRPITKEIRIGRMKKMFFIVNGKVLKDQKSKPVGCLIVMTDVTRLKQLEAMRRVFVANVSHELKTPITSIGGYVETAQGDIPLETKNEFLEKAIRQNNRLNSIIDDLLRISRIEAI